MSTALEYPGIGILSGGGTLLAMAGLISPWWLFLTLPILVLGGVGFIVYALD